MRAPIFTKSVRIAAITAGLALAPIASAATMYIEMGGGAGWLMNADQFFGTSTAGMTIASNFNLGLMVTLFDAPFDLHLGLLGKETNGGLNGLMYTEITPWFVARVQWSRIFISGGLTIFDFKRVSPTFGWDGLTAGPGSGWPSFLGEAGFLIPMAPNLSLSLQAGAQILGIPGGYSPYPALDLSANLRIYLWYPSRSDDGSASGSVGSSGSAAKHSNEFKGWRYPF